MKKNKDLIRNVYALTNDDIDISAINDIKDLESAVKWNINFFADSLIEENQEYIKKRSLDKKYRDLYLKLEQALEKLSEASLLKKYEGLLENQIAFYDPYQAYLAGEKLRQATVLDKEKAYTYHLSQIRKKVEYLAVSSEIKKLFERITEMLKTEELRLSFCNLTQLHNSIYGITQKKLKVFFDLGFAGNITFLDDDFLSAICFRLNAHDDSDIFS